MKKTLIVIDMQNDFIDGSLGTKEAINILPTVKRKIEKYITAEDNIIFTRDTHQNNYLDTLEGKKLPIVHCIENTMGWEIKSEIYVDGYPIINKPTFGYIDWKNFEFEEIEIIGLCTDICVVSNALILKALFPENEIVVDSNCCAGVTVKTHEAALETMRMCHITVI